MKVIDIPLGQIDIGERRREDIGDIGALAQGIKRVGLLEPIIVDRNGNRGYRLVVGERRLRAAWLLQWETIPAQLREQLTDAELRDIEFEENENRKPLTERERARTFASSKKLKDNAAKAREILAQSAQEKTGKRGQPVKPTSQNAVAEALGTDRRTVERAEQHVETAERFPFMQTGTWRQSDVLRFRERLEELPEAEREDAASVLKCAKLLDPLKAVDLVENIAAKKPEERREIYQLSQSADPRQRLLALTKAAEVPPMPDRRIGILGTVLQHLNAAITPYPQDPITPQLIEIRSSLRRVLAAVKDVSYDARRNKAGAIQ